MVVKGLDHFRAAFAGDKHPFVVIGGAACDLWFTDQRLPFRPTKDLDVVLILEDLNPDFVKKLWDFIGAGGYQFRERGKEATATLYRFTKPKNTAFPIMLEILSRSPENIFPDKQQRIIPIRFQDAPSLSAILLQPIYYEYLLKNRIELDGLPVANVDTLVVFKAKAWLDLTARREKGEDVKSKDIKKHRGDVFRLAATLVGTLPEHLPSEIENDLNAFLEHFHAEAAEWPDILNSIKKTLPKTSPQALITALKDYFQLS